MHLVVLAAGLGTRFGGLKQLEPVGANGEAILDVLFERASNAGFDHGVVVVRAEIEAALAAHLETFAPPMPITRVRQPVPAGRDRPLGTAHAVLVCREEIDGPFAVVNADDLYPAEAFAALAEQLAAVDEHALVAFRLGQTVLGDRPVSRAVLVLDARGDHLARIEENTTLAPSSMASDVWVSMNMWGFQLSIFDQLERAVDAFTASGATGATGEVLLPDVVSAMLTAGTAVRVLRCEERCIGITYAEDVSIVRAALG